MFEVPELESKREYMPRSIRSFKAEGIYGKGQPGDIVIVTNVGFSQDDALAKFPQPFLFLIIGRNETEKKYTLQYQTKDHGVAEITVNFADGAWLYSGQSALDEVVRWHKDQFDLSWKIIDKLQSYVRLLANILSAGNLKMVPQEQIAELEKLNHKK